MTTSKTSKIYPSNKETHAGQPKDRPQHSKKNEAFGYNSKQKEVNQIEAGVEDAFIEVV